MKEQIDRLTEKVADELRDACPGAAVIVIVADGNDAHMAMRGEMLRKIGVMHVCLETMMREALKSAISS